ncbi:hypothetical protein FRC10_010147 [Ceratobasidium sp. 414]|nr:hypothetical protein FRC10_010147 [Ceratobasidium sp. 414]
MYLVTLFSVALATTRVFALDAEPRDNHAVKIDSLPITANFKLPDAGMTLPEQDRARFKALFARGRDGHHAARGEGVRLKNTAIHYTMKVGVGSPPTYYDLLLDSGSGYTWIGAKKKYVKTKTSFKQPQSFYANYASGSAVGDNYKDLVTLSPTLSISNKSIGVATSTNGVEGMDGILGLGPATLSNVLEPNNGKPVPTVLDALFAQKKISQNVFGLSFAPTTSKDAVDGEVTFGGTNSAKYTGNLNWVEATKKEPYNQYWGYEQSIQASQRTRAWFLIDIYIFHSTETRLFKRPPLVFSLGTTLVYITPKAFKVYSDSLPGSKLDDATHLLEIPKESVSKMKSLFFNINGVPYEFTPNAQLWPRSLNTALGGKADSYYSVVSAVRGNIFTAGSLTDLEADMGSSFVNGYVFL